MPLLTKSNGKCNSIHMIYSEGRFKIYVYKVHVRALSGRKAHGKNNAIHVQISVIDHQRYQSTTQQNFDLKRAYRRLDGCMV